MKRPALGIAIALFAITLIFVVYRVVWLGYPLFVPVHVKAWQFSFEAQTRPQDGAIDIRVGLPDNEGGRIVAEERISSGPLQFNLIRSGANQIGQWNGITDTDMAYISYRALIYVNTKRQIRGKQPELGSYPEDVSIPERDYAARFVAKWKNMPPVVRLRAILNTVGGNRENVSPSEEEISAWPSFREKHGHVKSLLLLLTAADLPAREVGGLLLINSVVTQPLQWIEVWTGREWERVQPGTGMIYSKDGDFLPLMIGAASPVRAIRGEIESMRWTLTQQVANQWRIQFERIARSGHMLDRWSLFSLPPEFQGTFRIFLLVPIGALLICVLRNVIGFPTFGIFMPVLMALAFRSTGLVFGLSIFAGIVLMGYLVRRWIDRLRLLLVPRLSVILTLVIFCFVIFALVGSKVGFREFMAVGLLPFVILTMTIERFFVIVEEAGPKEGLRTAAGSAVVAAITYEIIRFEPLQMIFFVFPELLFSVGGLQILLGRYKGYRISELIRFKSFREK